MFRVEITNSFVREVKAKFWENPRRIVDILEALEYNQGMGKFVGDVAGVQVRELEYEWLRFYFVVDGHRLRVLTRRELVDLLVKFAGMLDKRQKKVFREIRDILVKLGVVWF